MPAAASIPAPPASHRSGGTTGHEERTALPPLRADVIAASSDGLAATSARREAHERSSSSDRRKSPTQIGSHRFGFGNPLTNSGSTIIGLGTVGLGDRCSAERKRMYHEQYEQWKRKKENQEIADRIASGGSTPKKPLTSKEVYIRNRNAEREKQEKRMEAEMEVARLAREDAARRKAELQQARAETAEFYTQFFTSARETAEHAKQQRQRTPRQSSHSPSSARSDESNGSGGASSRRRDRLALQESMSQSAREQYERNLSLREPIRKLREEVEHALDATHRAKQEAVTSARKQHDQRAKKLEAMEKARLADLKELAKSQRLAHQAKQASALEHQLLAATKEADRIRELRSPRSRDAAAKKEEERQRNHAQERKRLQEEHEQLIYSHLSSKREIAEIVRAEKTSLAQARQEDARETIERKQMLHEDVLRTSPSRQRQQQQQQQQPHHGGSGSGPVAVGGAAGGAAAPSDAQGDGRPTSGGNTR